MPDHVGVGVVEHDQVVLAGADRRDGLCGQFGRRHFGLQVIGRDLGRRHHDAVLAVVRLLAAAVEKIRHVRILLGLRHAELRAAGGGNHLAEDVRKGLRRQDGSHQLVEFVGVLRHADRAGETNDARTREAGEIRIEHRAQNLPRAIGAEVEAQHAVAVPHAAIIADHRRQDELVELLFRISVRDRGLRIGKARRVGVDNGVIRLLDALPALVAVHAVIAADHCGDAHRRRQRGDEPLEIVAGGLWRRIAPVGQSVNEGWHACVGEDLCQRHRVVLVRMHAAGRHQADEVAGAAARLELADQIDQRRRAGDLARRDGVGDAWQVLHDDAAGADVEMADLGVAHLAVRQADVVARGAQERARPRAPQTVEGRRPRLAHGVVGAILAPTPAIENNQHDGTTCLHVKCPSFPPT